MLEGNIPKTKAEVLAHVAKVEDTFEGVNPSGATPAGTGVAILTNGAGYNKTVLKLTNTPLPLIDTAGVVARCALKVLDMPAGLIHIAGAVVNLALTKSAAGVNADWDGDVSLGSAAAVGDATLTSTEANIVPSTATPQAVTGATTAKAVSTAGVMLDGTATSVDVYLNVLVDDADQDVTGTPTNLIANGEITIVWANLGDK